MARRRKPNTQRTTDGYQNAIARVGLREKNQHSASTYQPNWTSRNRLLVENAYRSSWLVGQAVDAVADDMTRKGVLITSTMEPSEKKKIESAWDELSLWDALNDTIKWSRLYGGAVAVILIEGQQPDTPLRLETIGKDSFKGLLVLDRWMITPRLQSAIVDLSPDLGKPEFYDITTVGNGIPAWKIHHSRLIRFDGVGLPFNQARTENGWGMSIIERLYDRIVSFDSTTMGAAQLVYKAHLRTYKIEKFRELIAMGGKGYNVLMQSLDLIRELQSNEGMTVMDAKDEFETHQYSFSGLSDVIAQFAQQVSGAIGIPLVRLFGQSPAGFSTGDADLANYYDNVNTQQERRLRRPLRLLFDVLCRSELGKELPEDFNFEFNPLWQISDLDRSTVAANTVNALNAAVESGLMTLQSAMTELRDTSNTTGIGSAITDEDIENAKDVDPPSLGENSDINAETTEASGKPISNAATQDSQGGRGYRQRLLRWFR